MRQGDLFGHQGKDEIIVKTIWLDKVELAKVIDYGTRRNLTGGFQYLVKAIYEHTDKITGKMELTDIMIARIMRYGTSYKQGGFQDTFLRPVFRRHFNL